eukprot:1159357-Pelagomonas_calceolata.AAC.8
MDGARRLWMWLAHAPIPWMSKTTFHGPDITDSFMVCTTCSALFISAGYSFSCASSREGRQALS